MGLIELIDLEFFAYHGFYDEEQKVGNKYSVDIKLETDLINARKSDKLNDTINYEDLYKITKDIMKVSTRLLEHIAQKIITEIGSRFPQIKSCEVSVSKYNPPVGGVCKKAKITIKEFF